VRAIGRRESGQRVQRVLTTRPADAFGRGAAHAGVAMRQVFAKEREVVR
jgi:hypothetical protein